jgi:hypothetical protein
MPITGTGTVSPNLTGHTGWAAVVGATEFGIVGFPCSPRG